MWWIQINDATISTILLSAIIFFAIIGLTTMAGKLEAKLIQKIERIRAKRIIRKRLDKEVLIHGNEIERIQRVLDGRSND